MHDWKKERIEGKRAPTCKHERREKSVRFYRWIERERESFNWRRKLGVFSFGRQVLRYKKDAGGELFFGRGCDLEEFS